MLIAILIAFNSALSSLARRADDGVGGLPDCMLIASLIRGEREGTRADEDDEVDRGQTRRVQL